MQSGAYAKGLVAFTCVTSYILSATPLSKYLWSATSPDLHANRTKNMWYTHETYLCRNQAWFCKLCEVIIPE